MIESHILLLVEDDPADARLIMRAIHKALVPALIVHVKDGDAAVAYLSGAEPYSNRKADPLPSLVLLDMKLPRRSGLEVLRWLREQKSGAERVPVVMLSSSQHTVDINRAYECGVNSYLVKPETSDQLLTLLSSLKEYWFTHNQGPVLQS
jgi:CheY-like chemotaxis protein